MDASQNDRTKKKARPLGLAFVNVTKCFTVRELRLWRLKNVALFAQAHHSLLTGASRRKFNSRKTCGTHPAGP
jgi:hypothetical protein